MEPQVVLVNKRDEAIGVTGKLAAHQQALLHRAFSVFIFNSQHELLLQQRQLDKYHCAGLWTNTCCSHPSPDENIILAGERRLREELGILIHLSDAGQFIYRAEFENGLTEHELDHVLVGHYHDEPYQINTTEIVAVKWMSITTLKQVLRKHPEQFTPWLSIALSIAISSL